MQQTSTCTGYITTEWADIKERVQILYAQPCAELFNLLIGGGGCRTPTYLCAIAWLADSAVVHWLSRVWRARSSRWTELTNDRPITALIIDCLHGRATMASDRLTDDAIKYWWMPTTTASDSFILCSRSDVEWRFGDTLSSRQQIDSETVTDRLTGNWTLWVTSTTTNQNSHLSTSPPNKASVQQLLAIGALAPRLLRETWHH